MAYTQDNRICSIDCPDLGKDVLLLRSMTATESLSQPFRLSLELMSEDPHVTFEKVVGKSLTVAVEFKDGTTRHFNGVVKTFAQGAADDRFIFYQAEVVPWLALLDEAADCRIFQEMTATDIIKQVFEDRGYRDYDVSKLSETYATRTYCVQYRETDFNFVSRLMEEEGISYYFTHEEKRHTLVLTDDTKSGPKCAGRDEVTYASSSEGAHVGEVSSWTFERQLRSGAIALTDYNFETPSTNLGVNTTSVAPVTGNEKLEVYDYPGIYADSGHGQTIVKRRMEATEAASVRARGASDCPPFTPGHKFKLVGHYVNKHNVEYVIASVVHSVTEGLGDERSESTYANDFTCIPSDTPYRPPQLTRRPFVQGVQTAVVVGPANEEIYVDEYGRVKVQFPWDREGKEDENSSCWIRVSQNWAGKNWGAHFWPRIGQEVIVDFIEGDPDRPIITGRVYNAEVMPPYDLPAKKTHTGIKSRSSMGGGTDNFNEIRFEDTKGEELFYVHAEKDREKMVENDENAEVGHDRARKVGNNETVDIIMDQQVNVGQDHFEAIGRNEELSVKGERTRTVSKDETVTVSKSQTLTVGENRKTDVGKDQTIAVAKDQTETVGGGYDIEVAKDWNGEAKSITFEAKDEILLKAGRAQILLKKNGDIVIKGAKVSAKASGNIVLKGSKIAEN